MTDLALLQRRLLALIKGSAGVTDADEPYLHQVASSDELTLAREIVLWWRAFQVERYCVLTAAVLKRREVFDAAISDFVRTHQFSPFIETLGQAFLAAMSTHPDPLVASVASFELALVRVKQGDRATYVVDWDVEPYAVLDELLTGRRAADVETAGRYRTITSTQLPRLFEVVQIPP
jgi:hypothetical protein